MRYGSGSAGQGRGGERRLNAARQLLPKGLQPERGSCLENSCPRPAACGSTAGTADLRGTSGSRRAALRRMSPRGTQVRAGMGSAGTEGGIGGIRGASPRVKSPGRAERGRCGVFTGESEGGGRTLEVLG